MALRTLKAETVVGLNDSALENLDKKFPIKEDKSWLISGDYAVAQLFKI